MSVISVRNLVKRYGDKTAVDDVSFTIEAGEVYGLLGENGAGKTTTVEILEGHRSRTAGDVSVLGVDPAAGTRDFRDRIGIVLQSSGVEPKSTVREAIAMYGSCYRRRRPAAECIDLVGLGAAADQRIETLSGGQTRRLDLALGIVGRPELLFLDEPTTGFDPAARRSAWELVRSLCADGTTVLLTSHYLDEVEQLADRVGVLVGSRMVAEGTAQDLAATTGATTVRFALPDGYSIGDLGDIAGAQRVESAPGGIVEMTTATPTATAHAVTGWALERGVELGSLTVTRPSLEDTFLSLTGLPRTGEGE